MHWRRRLTGAPRPVRGAPWIAAGAGYDLLLAGPPGGSTTNGAVGGTVLAVLGLVLVAAEPWTRRREARRLGWLGDPALLPRVRADVAAGRVPTATVEERELARRDSRSRLERLSLARPAAVLLGIAAVLSQVAGVHGHDLGWSWVLLLLVVGPAQVSAWVTVPRCRRALAELGEDEPAWARRACVTAGAGVDRRTPRG